jgi:hypothetical protein
MLRCETCRTFTNKKKGISERQNNEFETNSMNKVITDLYRGINKFKKRYQPMYSEKLAKDRNSPKKEICQ